ncbi:hypothetical protein [Cognatishimia sp. MH4019]|uniref:hypothetical protein n=1 Tax=Cognatishimia sp. MH4019 TaxID=2854030 RepID=UPI001CD3C2EC|nr:hypothetical protein [Cognatishimia sp. MH4019]
MSDYSTQSSGGGAKGLLLVVVAIIAVIALLGFFGASSVPTDDGTAPAAVEETAPAATDAEPVQPAPTE